MNFKEFLLVYLAAGPVMFVAMLFSYARMPAPVWYILLFALIGAVTLSLIPAVVGWLVLIARRDRLQHAYVQQF